MMRSGNNLLGKAARIAGGLVPLLFAIPHTSAQTPPKIWDGARRVQILCLVTDERGTNVGPLRDTLCRAARDRAAIGAPVPVAVLAQPGSEVLDPSAVTLLVQASVSSAPGGRLLALTVRPYRNQADDSGILFGAAPRAVLMTGHRATAQIAGLVQTTIDETLPWHARAGSRRLPPHGAAN